MNDETIFGRSSELRGNYSKLGQWLQQVLQLPETTTSETGELTEENDSHLELQFTGDYHISFYQQLPDFIMALLNNDAQATVHYAPLLFHLAGCHECHHAYLDLYDAMRAAVQPRGVRPLLGQGTRTLSATPHRMLSHLSQSLISQAEAILRQARHEHIDNDEAARSLLQLALRVSAHINQSSLRRQALKDLVRVATLFGGASAPADQEPNTHSYTPVMVGAGGVRRGKTSTRPEINLRTNAGDNAIIHLQARNLEGSVTQNGETLELHLQDLDPALRGQFVTISVFLGSLLEPVRWRGGNPHAIRSTVPVDENGMLITPIGQTELSMSQAEERNLLEAMFMLLEVRKSN
ncbi:hypothetical protein [Dictyobacter kobayashii]|uniref:Uncharacterized protein n=1 Tax=Dictyobacter kobayashii TaxID=2014872 RepID=A0A402AJU1_9CHLR|nr:hypothetical protein [Dictyobacter kobayashii]GCE19372.1 hypothetical protein KDK_31720 [Dictyobacter kobayashii]